MNALARHNLKPPMATPLIGTTRLRRALPVVCGLLAWHILLITSGASPTNACIQSTSQPPTVAGTLIWKNGDRAPGQLLQADKEFLHWQADGLFREPLILDRSYLDRVEFSNTTVAKPSDRYVVQTTDGCSIYGTITELDDRELTIESTRFGILKVDRSKIGTILDLQNSGSLISGDFDLDQWNASRGQKKYWTVNQNGSLESTRENIHLYREMTLPDSALIEVELAWDRKLDFILGFGVPVDSRKLESLARLEAWDDSIVLSFNRGDEFEIVMDSLDAQAKRVKFLIHWNTKNNEVVIHDERGFQLAAANIGDPAKGTTPGIFVQNKAGDLVVNSLAMRRSGADFDATQPSIQTLTDAAINGRLKSFSAGTWVVQTTRPSDASGEKPAGKSEQDSTSDEDAERDNTTTAASESASESASDSASAAATDTVEVSTEDFCGAFLINPSSERLVTNTRVKFNDGMTFGGELVAATSDTLELRTNFCSTPARLQLDSVKLIRFAKSSLLTKENFSHRLFNSAGQIQGRLEPGTGVAGDVLRWRLAGAQSAVPFSRADARIVLQPKQSIATADEKWGDTLYLKNRDTIPCRVLSINEDTVEVESFMESTKIAHDLIQAIDFKSTLASDEIAVDSPDWVIPEKLKRKVRTKSNEIQLSKGAEIAHPFLFSTAGFEFDLQYDPNHYGTLELRTLVDDIESSTSGKKTNITLYAEQVFVSENSEPMGNERMQASNGKLHVEVKYREGKLLVSLDGKQVYSEPVRNENNRGPGVQFKLIDLYQQGIKCKLKNFKLIFSNQGGSSLIDPHRKEIVLTIPRLKKTRPPKHVLCATNGDMLRGRLVSMDKQFVMFESGLDVQRFPSDIVKSLVWLDTSVLNIKPDALSTATAEELAGAPPQDDYDRRVAGVEKTRAAELQPNASEAASAKADQVVQVLLHGDRRMTSTLQSWADGNLSGDSTVLGRCQVPYDQIYELRFGSFATEAKDVPYSDWVVKLAPAPKMDAGPGGAPLAFGQESPLIGTQPKSFTLNMLDGSRFELGKQRGKVVVLDFWATWCGPCVQALPKMVETLAEYNADAVVFVAVNQEEGEEQIRSFLENRNLEFPVALDPGKVGRQFDVNAIPQTVIIDQTGKVAFVSVGNSADLESKLKAAIDGLLEDAMPKDGLPGDIDAEPEPAAATPMPPESPTQPSTDGP